MKIHISNPHRYGQYLKHHRDLRAISRGIIVAATLLAVPAVAQNLFVANNQNLNNQIPEFTAGGTYVGIFATTTQPDDIAFDNNGIMYVASGTGNSVVRFAPDGTSLGSFVTTGLNEPNGLAFDKSGNLYVANYNNDTIHKYSSTGVDLGTFASGVFEAHFIAFDSAGDLFAPEWGNADIKEFNSSGTLIKTITSTVNGSLFRPNGLAFDTAGNLYVADAEDIIQEFNPTLTTDTTFASGLTDPEGLAFDGSDLYAANFTADTIGVYNSSGTLVNTISSSALASPEGLAFAVPEPSVAGLLIGGTVLGLALRYRREWRLR